MAGRYRQAEQDACQWRHQRALQGPGRPRPQDTRQTRRGSAHLHHGLSWPVGATPCRQPTLRGCATIDQASQRPQEPATTSARQACASDRRPPPRRVRPRLVPFASGRSVCLQADDFELGKLVGIVGGCQRHGALRQSHVGGAFKEPARGIDVAAFDQFQTLAVEMAPVRVRQYSHRLGGGRAGAAARGGDDGWLVAITNVVFASATTFPSRLTRSTTISEEPCAPIGTIAARAGSTEKHAFSQSAHPRRAA